MVREAEGTGIRAGRRGGGVHASLNLRRGTGRERGVHASNTEEREWGGRGAVSAVKYGRRSFARRAGEKPSPAVKPGVSPSPFARSTDRLFDRGEMDIEAPEIRPRSRVQYSGRKSEGSVEAIGERGADCRACGVAPHRAGWGWMDPAVPGRSPNFSNMKPANLLCAGWVAVNLMVLSRAANPEIEFSGVLVAGAETKVALAKKGTAPAQWIQVGGEFGGYSVAAYDGTASCVVLTKKGEEFRIPLRDATVVVVPRELPPEEKQAIMTNLRQLSLAADQYYLENGKYTALYSDLVYVKPLYPKSGEDYRTIVFKQGQPLTVTTASGVTVTYQP